MVRIGIVGDLDESRPSHTATRRALEIGAKHLGMSVETCWLSTESLEPSDGTRVLETFDGIWAAPGSPYRSMEGALAGIRFARERDWPFFAT